MTYQIAEQNCALSQICETPNFNDMKTLELQKSITELHALLASSKQMALYTYGEYSRKALRAVNTGYVKRIEELQDELYAMQVHL